LKLVFWISFWTFLIDQISKYYVVHVLKLDLIKGLDVFSPYLNFRMAWNTGINFGLFSGQADIMRWVLILVALAIVAAVIWWVRNDPAGRWQKIAAGLLIGGALGNVMDRLLYGAVADFLNMSCCGFNNPFSFNLADICVFVGAFGMIVFSSDQKPA